MDCIITTFGAPHEFSGPTGIALGAVTFFFAVIQLGPFPVWLPVAIWLGSQGEIGLGHFYGRLGRCRAHGSG